MILQMGYFLLRADTTNSIENCSLYCGLEGWNGLSKYHNMESWSHVQGCPYYYRKTCDS